MTPGGSLLEGALVGGRYRVEALLGRGGVGAVYRVRHARTDEQLALKVLHAPELRDQEALRRFRREARAPARIDSEHVVRIVDADVAEELGGAPFLVMELLRGRDLGARIAAQGRLSPTEVVRHLAQAADALDRAHAAGIVHRDLKPENLFLAERTNSEVVVKVLDFGVAKLLDTPDGGAPTRHTAVGALQTAAGEVVGTPRYMAPEQARGDNEHVGPPADVWAIGMMTFKLLSGGDYWRYQSLPHLILQIAVEPMPAPRSLCGELPAAFDAWFARCCARDPAARFESVSEAVSELAAAIGVPDPFREEVRGPLPAPPSPPRAGARALVSPTAGRRIGLLVGGAIFVAGAAIAATIVLGLRGAAGDGDPRGEERALASKTGAPCVAPAGGACADINLPDPQHVDAVSVYPMVERLVQKREPRAALMTVTVLSPARDGTVDLHGDGRVVYQFLTGSTVLSVVLQGHEVVYAKKVVMPNATVAPEPRCTSRGAMKAAARAGLSGAAQTIVYAKDALRGGGNWYVNAERATYWIDGVTCAFHTVNQW